MLFRSLARDRDRFDITAISAEPWPNYDRIQLSRVLSGERRLEDIFLNSRDWHAANGVRLVSGDAAATIDVGERRVTTISGRAFGFDKLVIATGSRPLAPPVPGVGLAGVLAFRTIADLEAMCAASARGGRAVVVGGGLLGLEAANGLLASGMGVTVLHLMPTLMERQLDEAAGLVLQRTLESRGLEILTRAHLEEIIGDERVRAVRLADGRMIDADLVVLAIGVRPNSDLARAAGLDVNRGIVVDDAMLTSDAAIHAVGECVEHRGRTFGLVGPLWDQARACAAALCGLEAAPYVAPTPFTSLKITGVHVFSAGVLGARDDADEEITLRDAASGVYKKLVVRDARLTGAILYGDIADGPWFVDLIESSSDVSALRDLLMFGRAAAAAGREA